MVPRCLKSRLPLNLCCVAYSTSCYSTHSFFWRITSYYVTHFAVMHTSCTLIHWPYSLTPRHKQRALCYLQRLHITLVHPHHTPMFISGDQLFRSFATSLPALGIYWQTCIAPVIICLPLVPVVHYISPHTRLLQSAPSQRSCAGSQAKYGTDKRMDTHPWGRSGRHTLSRRHRCQALAPL